LLVRTPTAGRNRGGSPPLGRGGLAGGGVAGRDGAGLRTVARRAAGGAEGERRANHAVSEFERGRHPFTKCASSCRGSRAGRVRPVRPQRGGGEAGWGGPCAFASNRRGGPAGFFDVRNSGQGNSFDDIPPPCGRRSSGRRSGRRDVFCRRTVRHQRNPVTPPGVTLQARDLITASSRPRRAADRWTSGRIAARCRPLPGPQQDGKLGAMLWMRTAAASPTWTRRRPGTLIPSSARASNAASNAATSARPTRRNRR